MKTKTVPVPTSNSINIPEAMPAASGQITRGIGLVEEVYERIKADIMSVKIPPDTRISVDSLVRELGVSQTPIREALSMLEAIGLVTKEHYIGYCTAPTLDRSEFEKLYEIRLVLEPYAARAAALRISDTTLVELRSLAATMEQYQEKGTRTLYGRFADIDAVFHARIAESTGNHLIAEALARLHTHLHIFRLRFHAQVTRQAIIEHTDLINALECRDGIAAENAMRAHLEKSYARLVPFALEKAAKLPQGPNKRVKG